MGKKVFQLSFKDNEKEQRLYNAVVNSYNKSAFVKECIEFYLENKCKEVIENVSDPSPGEVKNNDIDEVDWDF